MEQTFFISIVVEAACLSDRHAHAQKPSTFSRPILRMKRGRLLWITRLEVIHMIFSQSRRLSRFLLEKLQTVHEPPRHAPADVLMPRKKRNRPCVPGIFWRVLSQDRGGE
jgi:hypothetical protein